MRFRLSTIGAKHSRSVLPAIRTEWAAQLIVVLACVPLVFGCGAGSQSSGASGGTSKNLAAAVINIKWPQIAATSRLIPQAAQSILITVNYNGARVTEVTIPRPAQGVNQTTATKLNNLPAAPVRFAATAFPNADASGVAQAAGTQDVTLNTSNVTPVNITMGTTITRVKVNDLRNKAAQMVHTLTKSAPTRDNPALTIDLTTGGTDNLSVEALDVDNNTVLVNPKNWKWAPAAGSTLTVAPTQDTAIITGGAAGATTMTVTESESGMSALVDVDVANGGAWSQFFGNAQNTFSSFGPRAAGNLATRLSMPGGPWPSATFLGVVVDDPTDGVQMPGGDGGWYHVSSSGSVTQMFSGSPLNIYGMCSIAAIGPDADLYAVSGSAVECLTPAGAVKWSIPLTTTPGEYGEFLLTLSANGVLYVPSGQNGNKLSSIDAATGAINWTQSLPQFIASKPAIGATGTVFVAYILGANGNAAGGGGVSAINPTTGAVNWSTTLSNSPNSAYTPYQIAVAPGGQVVVQCEYSVQALDPNTGALLWSAGTYSESLQRMIVTARGTIVCTTDRGHGAKSGVQGLDAATGAQRWQILDVVGNNFNYAAGAAGDGTVYIENDHVLTAGTTASINAVDSMTGTQIWSFNNTAEVDGPMSDILAIGKDGKLYLYDRDAVSSYTYILDIVR